MRPLPLLAAGLLTTTTLLTALLTAAPAQAAAETCQGRPTTIVGAPGQLGVTGTEGADVIVTNGASRTDALGGDDLVCVTGGTVVGDVRVDAGAGADVVDASAAVGGLSTVLGAGADTYTGSPYDERVVGGAEGTDTERDVITTGAGGADTVISGSDEDVPNGDSVVIAAGDGQGFDNEVFWTGPLAPGGRLEGNRDALLGFNTLPGSVEVDAAAGTLTHEGVVVLSWTGFDRFSTGSTRTPAPARFEFIGTDRDEKLELVFAKAHQGRQRLDMGGGADTLLLGDNNVGARGSRYVGGSGEDHVALWAGRRLDLDLRSGRLETRQDGRTVRARLTGFEDPVLGARTLVWKGTAKADTLEFVACRATVRSRGGADIVQQVFNPSAVAPGLRCNARRFRLLGGGGGDVLRGGTGRDLLVGGPGRDVVSGNAGRDTCSGEKLRSCEIKRR